MAQIKLIFACLFLILIFSQEIQPIDGRHLKLETTKEVPKLQTQSNFLVKETIKTAEHISSLHGDDMTNSKAVHASESAPPAPSQVINESQPAPHQGHVDDFRPTTPGHSPGVGNFLQKETGKIINADHISNLHGDSTSNKALVHGSESAPPAPSQVINESQPPPHQGHVEDFRPKSPGHSPGVRWKFPSPTGKIINAEHISNLHGDSTINKAPVHGSESQPPAPSQVINQPQAPPLGHQVDDFRPTSPGHSPGVGHFLQN